METNIYEIYTCNPETGEKSWDIKWVESTPEFITRFPDFDCIITTNDFCGGADEIVTFLPLSQI